MSNTTLGAYVHHKQQSGAVRTQICQEEKVAAKVWRESLALGHPFDHPFGLAAQDRSNVKDLAKLTAQLCAVDLDMSCPATSMPSLLPPSGVSCWLCFEARAKQKPAVQEQKARQ